MVKPLQLKERTHPIGSVYRSDIDGLRAIAVTSVVIYHAFPSTLAGGFLGVDIFFVISGYLISSIIYRDVLGVGFDPYNFYARRIRRIFPALITVIVFCYIVGWILLWDDELKQLGMHVAGATVFLSNLILWSEAGYFDIESNLKPLLHLWSLGIEEQFYIIWPVLVVISARLHRTLFIIGVVGLASFSLNIFFVDTDPAMTFYNPLTRFWELMVGSALAIIEISGKWKIPNRWANVLSTVGLAMIFIALLLIDDSFSFPGWWALLPTIGTALVIAAGNGSLIQRVLSVRILVFVGLISYPLYLWHWPLLSFLQIYSIEAPSVEARGTAVAISILFAWMTYKLVEQPLKLRKHKVVAPALGILLLFAGIVAYNTSSLLNEFRTKDDVAKLNRYHLHSSDTAAEWRRFRCMLETEGTFSEECIDSEPESAPLIFLWGDSHAAALYPGLRALRESYDFRIGQFSTSRCPPIIDFVSEEPQLYNSKCLSVNRLVLSKIESLRPRIVVMTAYWNIYSVESLTKTLELLNQRGVEKIILVGNVPVWKAPPFRTFVDFYQRGSSRIIPSTIAIEHFLIPQDSDSLISESAIDASVEFISLLDRMCTPTSCTAVSGGYLAYSDPSHLSPPASKEVVKDFFGPHLQRLIDRSD